MVGGEAFGSYEAFSAHNMLHKEGTRDVLPAEIHVHMKRLVPHWVYKEHWICSTKKKEGGLGRGISDLQYFSSMEYDPIIF